MSPRVVICINHFPLELLPPGATPDDARARCEQLQAEHRARSHVARVYWFATVAECEAAP